ncbi:LuxR C-terminal-related transcriptional regulator, partial [Klebsiella pneumoniae]|nr:LuxR C-terminal-related transcriptional regulator [Klebsiella pneumoniae]
FAGKKSAQIREILISESAWEEMTCLFAPSLTLPTLSLSKTESNMLQMWMAGHGTSQISTQMNIKAKTVSSHKGNIKKKIQTHNKQVIYHIVRLTENITSGIQVNMR